MSAARNISIVLPVFNGEEYLRSSLHSVLTQDVDFDLHVIDDCSTDASADIINSSGDRRIRYSRNPGRFGLFKTLNRGFSEALAEDVRIWAQDDIMLPNSLAGFASFARSHPSIGLVYSDFFYIDSLGRRTHRDDLYQAQRERTPESAESEESALLLFCFGCLPGNISTVLLRKRVWERAGGFKEGGQQAADYEMWLRVSEFSPVGFIKAKAVELRDHPDQLSKVGQKRMTTIEEEEEILRACIVRLSSIVSSREALSFWRQHRGRQHGHWVVRALLRGDFGSARRGIRALAKYGNPARQLAIWAATLNGRIFVRPAYKFFDEARQRLNSTCLSDLAGC